MHINKWTALTYVILLLVSISSLQPNELSWAIATGDEFEYSISVDDDRGDLNVIIEQLPSINQTPTTLSDILSIEVSISFSNDSSWITNDDIMQFLYSWALPVGNWDLMNTLIENHNNSYEELDVIAAGVMWRYNFIYHTSFSNETYDLDILYLKEDGMLFSYEVRITEGLEDNLVHEYRIERILENPDGGYQFFLYLGITVVCLGIVIYLARKYL